jgi:hypothetical protein
MADMVLECTRPLRICCGARYSQPSNEVCSTTLIILFTSQSTPFSTNKIGTFDLRAMTSFLLFAAALQFLFQFPSQQTGEFSD